MVFSRMEAASRMLSLDDVGNDASRRDADFGDAQRPLNGNSRFSLASVLIFMWRNLPEGTAAPIRILASAGRIWRIKADSGIVLSAPVPACRTARRADGAQRLRRPHSGFIA
jgi:hypothetical protein